MGRHQPAPVDQAAQEVLSFDFGSSVAGDEGWKPLPMTFRQDVTVPGSVGDEEDSALLGFTKQPILSQGVTG